MPNIINFFDESKNLDLPNTYILLLFLTIFMMKVQEVAIASILAYRPLLKEKMGEYPTEIFRLGYMKSARRSKETEMALNKIEVHLSRIFEILNSPDYRGMLREYAEETMEKMRKNYTAIKAVEISEREFRDFEEKLKKIEGMIRRTDDIYPLSYYLASVLEEYPKMIRMDYELLRKMKKEKYLSLAEEGFEKFPEKIIIFEAPIIALYLAFRGYRRMNLMQLSRLTGIFHTFIHLFSPGRGGVVELKEYAERIPVMVGR